MYPGPRPPGQKSPVSIGDGLHWQQVDQLTLLEAACLWAGIEPLDDIQDLQCSPEATACYRMLTQAVQAGELEANHHNPAPRTVRLAAAGQHAPDMIVSRADLEELAISIGQQPTFLFTASVRNRRSASKSGRKPDRRDAAMKAIQHLFPHGVPATFKRETLQYAVNEHLKSEGVTVSADTCDRARRLLQDPSKKIAD